MADEKHNDNHSLLDKLVAVLLRQSWLDVLGDVGNVARKIVQGRSYRGLYEVLECEATLKLEGQEEKVILPRESGQEDKPNSCIIPLSEGGDEKDQTKLYA